MTCFALVVEDGTCVVSSDGHVYGPDGEIPPTKISAGYRAVRLPNRKRPYLHRVVANAFLPNPESKPQVAHWDGNASNNRLENLRWVTQSENERDKWRHGRESVGAGHPCARLTETQVREIRKLREQGEHVDDIAPRFRISRWTVYDVCNPKRRWKHLDADDPEEAALLAQIEKEVP